MFLIAIALLPISNIFKQLNFPWSSNLCHASTSVNYNNVYFYGLKAKEKFIDFIYMIDQVAYLIIYRWTIF